MKKMFFAMLASALLIGVMAHADEAIQTEEKDYWTPNVSLNFQYGSRYLSDGKVCTTGSMLFSDVKLKWKLADYGEIYVDLFGAYDANSCNEADGIKRYDDEEIDFAIGYSWSITLADSDQAIDFDLSYAKWMYPNCTGWDEVGTTQYKMSFDVSSKFKSSDTFTYTPGLCIGADLENDAYQVKAYTNTSLDLTDCCGITKGKLSWNNNFEIFWFSSHWTAMNYLGNVHSSRRNPAYRKHDAEKNCLATFVWSTDFSYALNEHVSFGPFAKLAWALDHEVRDCWKTSKPANAKQGMNTLWGVQLTYEF